MRSSLISLKRSIDLRGEEERDGTKRCTSGHGDDGHNSERSVGSGRIKTPENVLPDWILHAVRGSHALVENRHGGIFDITGGSMLPGLGQVEAIKRQDGHWVVVTARGLITSVP